MRLNPSVPQCNIQLPCASITQDIDIPLHQIPTLIADSYLIITLNVPLWGLKFAFFGWCLNSFNLILVEFGAL